ncbi:membrane associated rhomboid family serine protease [Kitasatospora sp. MAP12-15]|uniref:rhomboid family intramembrane serine protease n=1 Tax=unclassified Kitasatospora TaxID=2633591 RepID=UPI002475A341|nr:rhomboid family intramembrane serine protease [Kitasatospora sp. MAP12-44]MDH6110059.1 membrane associated rhomboid family serine protease [Kitasatospora sp. MAP12-44]
MVLPVRDEVARPEDERAAPAPLVSYLLIALNCAVFLVGPSGVNPGYGDTTAGRACAAQRYQQRWGAIPAELLSDRPLTPAQLAATTPPLPACPLVATPGKSPALSVLTSLFVHGGWLHLLGNMLFLFVFGAGVEERLGRLRFLFFYLAAGALAAYGYALTGGGGAESLRPLVGASGAISGVLGGYLRLYPKARVTTLVPLLFFLPLRLPAWLVLGLWFAVQWWSARDALPGVAYLAHVIGFTAGFLAVWAACRGARYAGPTPPPPGVPQ